MKFSNKITKNISIDLNNIPNINKTIYKTIVAYGGNNNNKLLLLLLYL